MCSTVALASVQRYARTDGSDAVSDTRSTRQWSQIHVSRPHLEGIIRYAEKPRG